jgi:hypothetical protein
MTLVEGERECAGCGLGEVNVTMLYDIYLPPTVPRQLLCKPCLNILLDNEKKKKKKELE